MKWFLALCVACHAQSWDLYRASIAAAAASLRLDDTAAAQRWLRTAPEQHRGWEWRFLNAKASQSFREVRAHDAAITGLAVSNDGALLATTSNDAKVKLWDAAGGDARGTLSGHTAATWSPAFRPGTAQLASMGSDGTLRVWDYSARNELAKFDKLGNGLGAVAWSPDGKLLAAGTWTVIAGRGVIGQVYLWEYESRRLLWKSEFGVKPITSIAFRPDGKQFAIVTWDSILAVFDVPGDGKARIETNISPKDGSLSAMQSVTYSADGATIAVASKDNALHLFDAASGMQTRTLRGHSRWSNAAVFVGPLLATASSDATIRLWSGDGALLRTLHGHTAAIHGLVSAGESLVSAASDGTLRWWRNAGASEWRAPDTVYGLAFDASGSRIATASWGGVVKMWDTNGWEKKLHAASANAVAFSPNGDRIVTGGNDGAVNLIDAKSGDLLRKFETAEKGRAAVVAWSADGKAILAPSTRPDGKLWDPARTTNPLASITGGGGEIYTAQFSPDSRWLAVGWTDGTVRVIDWRTGVDVATIPKIEGGVYSVAFAPNGRELVTAGADRKIRQWSLPDGKLTRVLEGHTELIYSVGYSPDGTRLVSGSSDQTVRFWAARTGEELLMVPFSSQVYLAKFSPDGQRVAVAPMNGTVVLLSERNH